MIHGLIIVITFLATIIQCRNYKEALKATGLYLILLYGWIGILYGFIWLGAVTAV
jgi:hypothetical protein